MVRQVALSVYGWKDVTMGDKKPTAYTFTKNTRPQFKLLQAIDPMDYITLFYNDELLNNTVTETNCIQETKLWNLS
jgi:hypothetical protein